MSSLMLAIWRKLIIYSCVVNSLNPINNNLQSLDSVGVYIKYAFIYWTIWQASRIAIAAMEVQEQYHF